MFTQKSPILIEEDKELILEKNLVWVFGLHRSGTTWLSRQLLSYHTHEWNEPGIGHHLGFLPDLGRSNIRNIERSNSKENSEIFKKNLIDFN